MYHALAIHQYTEHRGISTFGAFIMVCTLWGEGRGGGLMFAWYYIEKPEPPLERYGIVTYNIITVDYKLVLCMSACKLTLGQS